LQLIKAVKSAFHRLKAISYSKQTHIKTRTKVAYAAMT